MRSRYFSFLYLIVAGLATWRITNIIQKEEIASPVRKAVGIIEPDGEEPDYWIYPDNFLGKVFHCFWCGSIWIGAGATILLFVFPPLLIPFALSALAIIIKSYIEQEPALYIENMWSGEEAEENDDGDSDA